MLAQTNVDVSSLLASLANTYFCTLGLRQDRLFLGAPAAYGAGPAGKNIGFDEFDLDLCLHVRRHFFVSYIVRPWPRVEIHCWRPDARPRTPAPNRINAASSGSS